MNEENIYYQKHQRLRDILIWAALASNHWNYGSIIPFPSLSILLNISSLSVSLMFIRPIFFNAKQNSFFSKYPSPSLSKSRKTHLIFFLSVLKEFNRSRHLFVAFFSATEIPLIIALFLSTFSFLNFKKEFSRSFKQNWGASLELSWFFKIDLKIYILLQKKLDNGIPYPEVRKGFVF